MRTRLRSVLAGLAVAPMAAMGLGGVESAAALPAIETILAPTTAADDGSAGSLRATLDAAAADPGSVVIELEGGVTYEVDRLCKHGDRDDNHGGDLDWNGTESLWIRSVGDGRATIKVLCDGERAFDHLGPEQVLLQGVDITGGNTANGAKGKIGSKHGKNAQGGGGIRAMGPLSLIDVSMTSNSTGRGGHGYSTVAGTGGNGGRGGDGGAIQGDVVRLTNVSLSGNSTGSGGNGGSAGGVNDGGNGGQAGHGGAVFAGDVTIRRSLLITNVAGHGGDGGEGAGASGDGGKGGSGGHGGAILAGMLMVERTSVIGNSAGIGGDGAAGGPVSGAGGVGGRAGSYGGVYSWIGEVRQVTIDGNRSGRSGAGGVGGGASGIKGQMSTAGGLMVQNAGAVQFSTITNNEADSAANVEAAPGVTVRGSVIGESVDAVASCSNPLTSDGWNVTDDAGCGLAGPTDLVSGDLGLDPLGVSAGAYARVPTLGGPLHGFIPQADCDAFAPVVGVDFEDQRGEPRRYGDCEPGTIELPPAGASAFTALPPVRVFDTRTAEAPSGFVGAGQTLTVDFTGVAGVPDSGVTAVAFNLTVDAAGGEGYVTAFPGGQPLPLASNLNTVRSGQIVPNMVIVPVAADGTVSFYTQSGGHLLADIAGYFTEAVAPRAGRIMALSPERLFDTRSAAAPSGLVGPGGEIAVPVLGKAGIPASGVSAVVLNLTGTEAVDAGFITAWPGATPRPLASSLNLAGPGHTAPNMVIVPVGVDGTVRFFSQSGAHLLADVSAYVTDDAAPASSEGLLVPADPARLFDTRDGAAPSGYVGAGATTTAATVGVAGVPWYASGVVANLTATGAGAEGFVTAWPDAIAMPTASVLNLTEVGETRANATILRSLDGDTAYYTQSGAHLLADAFGWLLPEPGVVSGG